ncbi:tetratricopeptide repeat-containing sensor histidine kinase [Flavobacterium sp. N3904]|uniref:tetratricopeptide repeat-containing sensor histidine kinase n=1 Tax=Flavobacterium sp. N3904 TaxID=2986835 RepID=UPI002224F837|nr:tetratricopeptide repeat-containing sensor histidine kinase [Flavobacterium sp. N3904]
MKKIIILFLIFTNHLIFSQKSKDQIIDSLNIELNHTKEDTVKVKILNQLSALNSFKNADLGLNYAKKALILSNALNYNKGIAYSYNNFSIYYWLKTDFPRALNYAYKALKIHEEENDKKGIASANNSLGIIYIEYKNYKLALKFYTKALKVSKEINDTKSTATYLNNIGDVYLRQKNYSKALYYFEQAIKTNTFRKDSFESGLNYTNIGITYNFLKQYKKSIEAINKSVLIYKNDSSLYNGFNKLEFGKSYYYLALNEKNQAKKDQLLQKSLDYVNESMHIFKREKSLIDIKDAYLYLSKIKKEQGKHHEALDYFEKSTHLNDSIFSSENSTQINLLESQREIELRDKKIEIQNLKIKNDSRKVYLLVTITIAVGVLLGLFFWLYLSKRRTNVQLEEKNKTISNINKQKDKFFSIIAHDLRGPFNGFLGLTELLAEDLNTMTSEEIQFAAASMKNSAANLNRLLENLLEWSRMEQGLIPFAPQQNKLKSVVDECIITLKDAADKKEIKINENIDNKTIVFADNNILHAVIRNILSNAIKFTPKGGTIAIQGKEDNKKTTISITDSGIGMNSKMVDNLFRLDVQTNRKGTNDEPSTGLGLILCREFIEKHSGKIWVESEEGKGTTFYFSFPKALQ